MKKVITKIMDVLSFGESDKEFLKSSEEWYEDLRKLIEIVILDPDGWDRAKYDFSFKEEQITKQHFMMRLNCSTVLLDNENSKVTLKNWGEDIS